MTIYTQITMHCVLYRALLSQNTVHQIISFRGRPESTSRYFWPILTPSPCHTLSHIPGPPKVRHTSRTPRFISRPSTKNPDKSPLHKLSLNCSRGLLSRGFCLGVFCPEGFDRGGFCPYPLLSEYICY